MSNSAPNPLERAIIALLKPLVRLVLKRGVAFSQFAELAKQVYVEVAKKDFAVPGRKMTVSRVAVLLANSSRFIIRPGFSSIFPTRT